jgi:hypothetical protein
MLGSVLVHRAREQILLYHLLQEEVSGSWSRNARVDKRPPLASILRQLNPIYALFHKDPFKYYPVIYAYVFEDISSFQNFRLKCFKRCSQIINYEASLMILRAANKFRSNCIIFRK